MMMLQKEYADDTGYTVDYDNTQSKDDIVLKKDGKSVYDVSFLRNR